MHCSLEIVTFLRMTISIVQAPEPRSWPQVDNHVKTLNRSLNKDDGAVK